MFFLWWTFPLMRNTYSFILKHLADVEGGCARSNLCSHIIRFDSSVLCVSVLVYGLRLNYSIKSLSHSLPPALWTEMHSDSVCLWGESTYVCLCASSPGHWHREATKQTFTSRLKCVKHTDGDQKQSRNMVHADCVFLITSSVFNTTTVWLFRDTHSNEL